jgi:hypothetical protein
MGNQIFIDENILATLEMVAVEAAIEHPLEGEGMCWCPLSVGINEFGLHTGHCQVLRKHFEIKREKDNGS